MNCGGVVFFKNYNLITFILLKTVSNVHLLQPPLINILYIVCLMTTFKSNIFVNLIYQTQVEGGRWPKRTSIAVNEYIFVLSWLVTSSGAIIYSRSIK